MVIEIAKDKSRSVFTVLEEGSKALTQPVEDVKANLPLQYQRGKIELQDEPSNYGSPVYLRTI